MNMVTWVGSFLLGGVSALLVMCLLLCFMEYPVKKSKDNKILKQVADALEAFPRFKKLQEGIDSTMIDAPSRMLDID